MSAMSLNAVSHAHASWAPRALELKGPREGAAASQPSAAEPARAHAGGDKAEADKERAIADEVRQLQARDAEVRAHEQAHAAAGGTYAGAPSFGYERGPDGRSYAVSGEVPIDVSAIAGDPEATIIKMQQVKRAALAPANPSNADRSIAATADAQIMAARSELQTKPSDAAAPRSAGERARMLLGDLAQRSARSNAYDPASPPMAGSVVSLVT
jgi:hypothetical protein